MEKELVNSAIDRLSEIVGNANIRLEKSPNPDFDYILHINDIEFLCKVKGAITTSNFGNIQRNLIELQKQTEIPILLVVQSIYPGLMIELIQNEINSMDVAGNCQIRVDKLILHVEGKKTTGKYSIPVSSKSRLFQEAGLKIIFRLLENPDWVNLPYRQIQESANVSLGSVNIIMNELIESGYILKTNEGKSLKNRKELLERWIVGYNDILKPKRFVRKMTFKDSNIKKDWKNISLPPDCFWGGESAANLYDGYLYPRQYTLYGGNIGALVKTGLRTDENGEIFVYNKFWTFTNDERMTPVLLTYADLMGSGNSRNIEAAQRIYKNELQHLQ
ncbi:type IV toxin-antitoxin system AbiEi family antitoxin [Parabacteroides sp. Marseille-P3160]|uniref:type IV toxin-antitoxin system AbiEi family antitoxin n=1 Tax=Parabacteroides sp. Marseille-P3160 TaxID=1917887 RepID=UPI0009BA17C6|nr:type IV toxin-antitoxin system AbiEi family antitoxin [Parabacteroides sp. Marseille-P3160]